MRACSEYETFSKSVQEFMMLHFLIISAYLNDCPKVILIVLVYGFTILSLILHTCSACRNTPNVHRLQDFFRNENVHTFSISDTKTVQECQHLLLHIFLNLSGHWWMPALCYFYTGLTNARSSL